MQHLATLTSCINTFRQTDYSITDDFTLFHITLLIPSFIILLEITLLYYRLLYFITDYFTLFQITLLILYFITLSIFLVGFALPPSSCQSETSTGFSGGSMRRIMKLQTSLWLLMLLMLACVFCSLSLPVVQLFHRRAN